MPGKCLHHLNGFTLSVESLLADTYNEILQMILRRCMQYILFAIDLGIPSTNYVRYAVYYSINKLSKINKLSTNIIPSTNM